ncbi:hypothetical protein JL722_728 [Aureococcus anophagefferens]|nr:hypothetical protein JL722_728 [Aureococcus anophagefferens]
MADSSSSDSSPDRAPPLHVMADSSDSDSSPDRAPPLHVMADSSDSDSSDRAPPPRATADSSSDGDGAPDAFLAASSSGSSDGDDAPRGAAAERAWTASTPTAASPAGAHAAAEASRAAAATLGALEVCARSVGAPAARVVLRWIDDDGVWRTLARRRAAPGRPPGRVDAAAVRPRRRGRRPLRRREYAGRRVPRRRRRGAWSRRLRDDAAHAKLLLDALRAASDRDAVGVLAAAEGLASLRSLAALDASTRGRRRARPARRQRRWLAKLATRDVWLAWAARGEPRPAHRRVLRALDATEPRARARSPAPRRGASAWLPPAPGALTATRPWDAKPGEPCAPRALAGCDALGAVLAAGGAGATGAYDRAARPRDVAAAALARCLPPEDVLSKKDLGRGLMHGDPAANRAALLQTPRTLAARARLRRGPRPLLAALLRYARELPEAVAAGRFDFANSARGFTRPGRPLFGAARAPRARRRAAARAGDDPAARRCRDRVVDAVADGEAPVAAAPRFWKKRFAGPRRDGDRRVGRRAGGGPVGASFGAAWDAARDHRGAFEDVRRAAAAGRRGETAAKRDRAPAVDVLNAYVRRREEVPEAAPPSLGRALLGAALRRGDGDPGFAPTAVLAALDYYYAGRGDAARGAGGRGADGPALVALRAFLDGGDGAGLPSAAAGCVEINHWFGTSRPNFEII